MKINRKIDNKKNKPFFGVFIPTDFRQQPGFQYLRLTHSVNVSYIYINVVIFIYIHHHHRQPGERTHLIVVPGVHSNRSVEEVLSHVSFQPQSISRIHPSFLSLLTKSHKQLEATSFSQYSLQGVPKETFEVGAQQQQQQQSSS